MTYISIANRGKEDYEPLVAMPEMKAHAKKIAREEIWELRYQRFRSLSTWFLAWTVIIAALVFCFGSPFSSIPTNINILAPKAPATSLLLLKKPKVNYRIVGDSYFIDQVKVSLKNSGTKSAYNILVHLVLPNGETWPFDGPQILESGEEQELTFNLEKQVFQTGDVNAYLSCQNCKNYSDGSSSLISVPALADMKENVTGHTRGFIGRLIDQGIEVMDWLIKRN